MPEEFILKGGTQIVSKACSDNNWKRWRPYWMHLLFCVYFVVHFLKLKLILFYIRFVYHHTRIFLILFRTLKSSFGILVRIINILLLRVWMTASSFLVLFFLRGFPFLLTITRSGCLAKIRWSVCIQICLTTLRILFSGKDSWLYIYHLFVWSNLNFLYNSHRTTFLTQSFGLVWFGFFV